MPSVCRYSIHSSVSSYELHHSARSWNAASVVFYQSIGMSIIRERQFSERIRFFTLNTFSVDSGEDTEYNVLVSKSFTISPMTVRER